MAPRKWNNDMNKKNFVKAKVSARVSPGESLRILRDFQEMSQNQLASLSGISQSNISAFENGSKQIGRETAIKFARALKVHPAIILFPDYDVNSAA